MTHIHYYLNWDIIGSGNGLSPVRRQANTSTNDDLLSIGPSGTMFSEIFIKIKTFSLTKLHWKMSSAKVAAILSQPQCVKVGLWGPDIDGILPKGPYLPCLAWQIGPFWQDTLDMGCCVVNSVSDVCFVCILAVCSTLCGMVLAYVIMIISSNGNIFHVTGHLCGNSLVTGEFPAQRPEMRSCCDVFFDLHLNKWLSKQSWVWWFDTPSSPLWHHCNITWINSG